MSNTKPTCERCKCPLPEGADPRRRYCGDRCRWAAAAASYRERNRPACNSSKAAAMRRLRLRRALDRVKRQAERHDASKRTDRTPEESAAICLHLLRTAASARGEEDPLVRWRERRRRERGDRKILTSWCTADGSASPGS